MFTLKLKYMKITGYTEDEHWYYLLIDGESKGLTIRKEHSIDEILEVTRNLNFELIEDLQDFIRKHLLNYGPKITFSLNRLNARIEETKRKIEAYSKYSEEDGLTEMERNFYFTEINKSICELNVLNWIHEERILTK